MKDDDVLSSMPNMNPRWLAPEIQSNKAYTLSSDVFSFGMIMFELLTWQLPWPEYEKVQVGCSGPVYMVLQQEFCLMLFPHA